MDDTRSSKDTDEPSTSKKKNPRVNTDSDDDDKRDGQDSRMDSEPSDTSCASLHSRVEKANSRLNVPKPIGKGLKESKSVDMKKRGKPTGRVEKRTVLRRQAPRKIRKRRRQKQSVLRRKRNSSMSTVFTRLSSRSPSPTMACMYCGHRCCRRRYQENRRKAFRRRRKVRFRRRMKQPKRVGKPTQGSECLQVGSKCLMLSRLCINTNAAPAEHTIEEPIRHCEVTPEMLHETLQRLTMWRQEVTTIAIVEYIKRSYPVSQDIPALFEEVAEKLHVAALTGIVAQTPTNNWRLSCALQNRHLTETHVTLFWKTYTDTMAPVTKKSDIPPANNKQDEQSTDKNSSAARYSTDYI